MNFKEIFLLRRLRKPTFNIVAIVTMSEYQASPFERLKGRDWNVLDLSNFFKRLLVKIP